MAEKQTPFPSFFLYRHLKRLLFFLFQSPIGPPTFRRRIFGLQHFPATTITSVPLKIYASFYNHQFPEVLSLWNASRFGIVIFRLDTQCQGIRHAQLLFLVSTLWLPTHPYPSHHTMFNNKPLNYGLVFPSFLQCCHSFSCIYFFSSHVLFPAKSLLLLDT